MNEQFLYRNQTEISQVITVFRELQSIHNFGLFLDKENWEIIDLEFGITIIRREFKQVKSLVDEMRHVRQSIVECGCIRYNREKRMNQRQSWAYRYLQKIYPEHYNYFVYGKF